MCGHVFQYTNTLMNPKDRIYANLNWRFIYNDWFHAQRAVKAARWCGWAGDKMEQVLSGGVCMWWNQHSFFFLQAFSPSRGLLQFAQNYMDGCPSVFLHQRLGWALSCTGVPRGYQIIDLSTWKGNSQSQSQAYWFTPCVINRRKPLHNRDNGIWQAATMLTSKHLMHSAVYLLHKKWLHIQWKTFLFWWPKNSITVGGVSTAEVWSPIHIFTYHQFKIARMYSKRWPDHELRQFRE